MPDETKTAPTASPKTKRMSRKAFDRELKALQIELTRLQA